MYVSALFISGILRGQFFGDGVLNIEYSSVSDSLSWYFSNMFFNEATARAVFLIASLPLNDSFIVFSFMFSSYYIFGDTTPRIGR